VIECKANIVSILINVSNLRLDYRLAKLLHAWRIMLEVKLIQSGEGLLGDGKSGAEGCFKGSSLLKDNSFRWLKEALDAVSKGAGWRTSKKADTTVDHGWADAPKTFNLLFEKIFMVHSHAPSTGKPSLDLDKMTKVPFDTVMLDLLMYEHFDLFRSSFSLFIRHYSQKKALLRALSRSRLLVRDSKIAIFKSIKQLLASLSMDLDSFSQWGMANFPLIPGEVEQEAARDETFERVCNSLQELMRLARANPEWQDMMRDLGAHAVMLRGFRIPIRKTNDIVSDAKGLRLGRTKHCNELLLQLKSNCYEYVSAFVSHNSKNQALLYNNLDTLMAQSTGKDNVPSPLAIEALGEIFANNLTLASQIPDEIFWHFGRCIENAVGDRIRLLQFFIDVISINGQAVKRNQDLALKVIMHSGFRNVNKSLYWIELSKKEQNKIIKIVQDKRKASGGKPLSKIYVGGLHGGNRSGVASFAGITKQKQDQQVDMREAESKEDSNVMSGRSPRTSDLARKSDLGVGGAANILASRVSTVVVEGIDASSVHHVKMGVYTLLPGRVVNERGVWHKEPSLRERAAGNTAVSYLSYSNNGKWGIMTEGEPRGWAKITSTALTPDKVDGVWQMDAAVTAAKLRAKASWCDAPQLRIRGANPAAAASHPAKAPPAPEVPEAPKVKKASSGWAALRAKAVTATRGSEDPEQIVSQLLYHCKLVECLALTSRQNIRTQAKLRLTFPPERIMTVIQGLCSEMELLELTTPYVQFMESVYLDTRVPFEGLVNDEQLDTMVRFMVEEMELYRHRTAPLLQSEGRKSTMGRDSEDFDEVNDLSSLQGLRGPGNIEMSRFGADADASDMSPMGAQEQWAALTRGDSSFEGSESSFGGSSNGGSSQGGTSMFSSIAETLVFNFGEEDEDHEQRSSRWETVQIGSHKQWIATAVLPFVTSCFRSSYMTNNQHAAMHSFLIDRVLLEMLQVCDKQDIARGKQAKTQGNAANQEADLEMVDQLRQGAIEMTQLLAPRAGNMTGWRKASGKSVFNRGSLMPQSSTEHTGGAEGSVREEIAIYIQEQYTNFIETINSSKLVAQVYGFCSFSFDAFTHPSHLTFSLHPFLMMFSVCSPSQLIEDEFDLMVRAFLKVKSLTDPDDKHYTSMPKEKKEHDPRVVMITFGELVERLVGFLEVNFIPLLKSGEPMSDESASWVPAALKLMRRCLELSLVDSDGVSILEPIYQESGFEDDDDEKEPTIKQEKKLHRVHREMQDLLNEKGATRIVIAIIAHSYHHNDDQERSWCIAQNLPEVLHEALKLGVRMLWYGNKSSQAEAQRVIVEDKQGLFFASCKRLASHAQATIRGRRGRHTKEQNMNLDEDDDVQEGDGVGGDDDEGDVARAASAQALIWRFLQLFCEGHNHPMQLLCSWQPEAKRKIDMVKEGCSVINLIAKDEIR
jgi:hypothetical protein